MPPVEIIQLLGGGAVSFALGLGLWGLLTARAITRFQYDELKTLYQKKEEDLANMKAERDIWIQRALGLNKVAAEASVETMKTVAAKVEG